mmetsp:Transcript_32826/g.56123  ORF Transcript_32826/g.56123 Transcript_32826/m.56123 type:complete len:188 (+) Transcript_32826:73-636(+)
MAKSIRSKVKKRLRSVKRGVLKKELKDPTTKIGVRTTQVQAKLAKAMVGDVRGERAKKNWFRSDDPDAEVPQHNFRQGPDFRAGSVPEAGYAVWGSNRPKLGRFGGDAPSAYPDMQEGAAAPQIFGASTEAGGSKPTDDGAYTRLLTGTEQIVPFNASKKQKKKLKAKATNKSGVEAVADHKKFRWT